ncbi:MAG: Imm8 family immunity protein [Thermoanaerobaculia bacterium]|jgi:hypothetical protein
MIFPKLKGLTSPDLDRPALPADPCVCSVLVEAEIGKDEEGADIFSFTVITPERLKEEGEAIWGRGRLVVPEFSWELVERQITKLLLHAARETWEEVAGELSKEMHWEFEDYRAS